MPLRRTGGRILVLLGLAGTGLAFGAARLRFRTVASKPATTLNPVIDCSVVVSRPPAGLPDALTAVTDEVGSTSFSSTVA